ncbi:iron-sulfur cluster carrier protein ApbC [Loktanella sp. TSTF-M6]|uniref:Iron-sulfur cluster carrier protein n=1 Tax=Loktanella gaetbuli TaxID=2881335 RepID=A0ABS8BPS8_9RHOB|nr:iron-sulfur cluster carrier protein ApbC [Loktanella gaetbuli]MCB5197728.1 iron-sulfur cluster carrier protein ApbC [Loktanella gaetbuli]
MTATRDDVQKVLAGITDPVSGGPLNASGAVKALNVDGSTVRFVLEIPPSRAADYEAVKTEAEAGIRALDGIETVSVVLTAHATPAAPPDLKPQRASQPQGPQKIPGVDRIIAIASGKGGVGKSTVTANLACALAAEGRRVGLLDADVYGPSQPRMLGVSGRPASPDGKTILPLRNYGVTMMSIGLMTNEDQAVVWRGPMLMGALQQMMTQVQWGALDVLLVDLPPGTGDVQMTLAQKAQVDGAIIVSTPQDIALLDARKGIDMFNQLHVPILGMIENMSTHICTNCGHEEHVFGHGGVAAEAAKLGVPLLAEVPLHLSIRKAADSGAPIVVSDPDSAQATAFRDVARALIADGRA